MKHKHAELIKAWADGAKIQEWFNGDEVIEGNWENLGENIDWQYHVHNILRIKPDCEYAIEKIRELGGDEAVEVYEYWLGGGEIELAQINEHFSVTYPFPQPYQNPLSEFLSVKPINLCRLRKKKQTVKQVLWIGVAVIGDSVVLQSLWLNKGDTPAENGFCKYHIAPGYEGGIEL